MISHDDVPYADPETLADLIYECGCVEGECAAHGVPLHPAMPRFVSVHPTALVIAERTLHSLDGYPDYGS